MNTAHSMTPERAGIAVRTTLTPLIARRLLRFELLHMCADTGMTHEECGNRLGVSRASLSQLLSGKNLPSAPALEVLAHYVDQGHRLPYLLELRALARKSRSDPAAGHKGRCGLIDDGQLAHGLEAIARDITVADFHTVPALLRCPAYARGLLTARADTILDESDLDHELRDLRRRQRVIRNDTAPTRIRWITDEHTLRRPVGDPAAMAEQCHHLLAMTARPNISIHILPSSTLAPVPTFQVLRIDDDRTVAQEDGLWAAHFHDKPTAIAGYLDLAASLRRRALDPDQSQRLLADLARTFDGGRTYDQASLPRANWRSDHVSTLRDFGAETAVGRDVSCD